MGVIIVHKVSGITFVASNLPPNPVSSISISDLILLNARNAAAVVISKKVIDSYAN